jgi:predicted DNA-binding transcriptional regulator AlpA
MSTLESFPTDFNSDRLVSDKVAAQLLSISLATLLRMRKRGEGPPRRQISQRRFGTKLSDIQAFLDRAAV